VLFWLWNVFLPRPILILLFASVAPLVAQLTPKQKADNLDSFELVWRTVRDRHPDPNLNGLDWPAIHDSTRPAIEMAQSMPEVRRILLDMLSKLAASHYAIIPADVYKETGVYKEDKPASQSPPVGGDVTGNVAVNAEPDSPPARTGIPTGIEQTVTNKLDDTPNPPAPKGTLVRFGNLPEMRVYFESRALPDGVGYIRFNEFLDPGAMMPKFEAALKDFAKAPGVILDLRGNPGGIGIMAMGVAGFFITEDGLKLGEMKMRDATLKFVIFPRPEPYSGPLAILVDGGSASTSEILAAGLQDLKRARVFGVRSAGAVLPSDIIRLPNGDGFQYAQASYTSVNGKVLEGAGVTPDVIVQQTRPGRDLVIEAADDWIRSTQH